VLDTGDASIIINTIKPETRHHVLTALANLAKYTGRYQEFLEIRRRYNLKWEKADPMKHFEKLLFNPELSLDVMLQRIRQMIQLLPTSIAQIIKFGVLVGLRSSEIIESARLINDKEAFPKYYDASTMTLSHFKFPKQFIRTTKKAFLSFVTPDMLSIVQNLDKVPSRDAITHACQRRHITCDTHFCRKVHATYLHEHNIPVEIIDALQGRTPASIFSKHYYRPSLDYKQKVLDALEELRKQIES
jgi:hypothetical protein